MEVIETKTVKTEGIFGTLNTMGHEQVVFCSDAETGLQAIIAIHNTILGPALGGTRMWAYTSETDALTDVLRLSRGMTYKAAISGVNLGGGKAVIMGDPAKLKNEALLRRFGKFVNSLHGKYITAEDVNMKTSDMEFIHMETPYVTGLPESMGGGGDPSPVTAYGVYLGMKAAAKKVWGTDSLADRKVSVQGIGQVGKHLVELLLKEGARLTLTDLYLQRAQALAAQHPVTVVAMDEIYDIDCDIYAPCALGATINDDTIGRLKCAVIAGAANNQLADEIRHGYGLVDRGIVYAPDFLINAGGLVNVYHEFLGNYSRERVMDQVEKIYTTCLEVLQRAATEGISTQEAAIRQAEDRIHRIGQLRRNR